GSTPRPPVLLPEVDRGPRCGPRHHLTEKPRHPSAGRPIIADPGDDNDSLRPATLTGMLLDKVISGGQTGADQGALRAARATGIPTGGWAPRRWLVESDDGRRRGRHGDDAARSARRGPRGRRGPGSTSCPTPYRSAGGRLWIHSAIIATALRSTSV